MLRALAETFVPGAEAVRLADHLAETIAALPHRAVNALRAGVARPFTTMSVPQRERYLRGWATSRLPLRRGRASSWKPASAGSSSRRDAPLGSRQSCGAVHSPSLLLRSGVRLPALGRHLALHPATAVFGLMDEAVRPWTGTIQAQYSDQFADLDRGYGFKFETAPLHPSLFALATPWESGVQHAEAMSRLPHTARG